MFATVELVIYYSTAVMFTQNVDKIRSSINLNEWNKRGVKCIYFFNENLFKSVGKDALQVNG